MGRKSRPAARDPKVGDEIIDEVPPVDLGRIAAQSAKQVILQKVREAERDRQYDEFKDRKGTIINGAVKREEYGNIIVDIGRGEGILRRNEKIGRKIRDNELKRIPYLLIVGEKEEAEGLVSVRAQGEGDKGQMPMEAFRDLIAGLVKEEVEANKLEKK